VLRSTIVIVLRVARLAINLVTLLPVGFPMKRLKVAAGIASAF